MNIGPESDCGCRHIYLVPSLGFSDARSCGVEDQRSSFIGAIESPDSSLRQTDNLLVYNKLEERPKLKNGGLTGVARQSGDIQSATLWC